MPLGWSGIVVYNRLWRAELQDSGPKLADAGHFPKPELNPLLNPLLEQNLGRWAQVYFTSPPEMREHAVSELLRELKGQPSDVLRPPSAGPQAARAPYPEERLESPATNPRCPACDAENRPQQRFCGFCGLPLGRGEPATARRTPAAAPYSEALPRAFRDGNEPAMPQTPSFLGLSSDFGPSSDRPESDRPGSDLQFLREKKFGSDFYAETESHRGRYLMAALVVALVVVATIQWPFLRTHLETALRRVGAAPSVPVSAPPLQTAAPPPAESTALPSAAEIPAQPPAAPVQAQPAPPPLRAETSAEIKDSRERVADRPVAVGRASRASALTLASDTSASRSAVDGTQELLLAQRYLQGNGTTPDPAAAARWLWKAVGKENPRAALLLADLYAQGDGVSKSCDQARILLDVAAAKGVSEAGPRLRSLEIKGCR
jgi:hypothetical protein